MGVTTWKNCASTSLIVSVHRKAGGQREGLQRVIVRGEHDPRRVSAGYFEKYQQSRTYSLLDQDALFSQRFTDLINKVVELPG